MSKLCKNSFCKTTFPTGKEAVEGLVAINNRLQGRLPCNRRLQGRLPCKNQQGERSCTL